MHKVDVVGDSGNGAGIVPRATADAVLVQSGELPPGYETVKGYTFGEDKVNYDALLGSYIRCGFQASHFGRAVDIVNSMVRKCLTL